MNYTNSILKCSFYLSSTVWKLVLQLSYVLIEVGITDITVTNFLCVFVTLINYGQSGIESWVWVRQA